MTNKNSKPIKQSVINTFNRVGIRHEALLADTSEWTAVNRFSGEEAPTTALIYACIRWVYGAGERGVSNGSVRVSDFDRVRYFVLEADKTAYMTCLD